MLFRQHTLRAGEQTCPIERQVMMVRKQVGSGGLAFLKAETDTGLTFAELALQSDNASKVKRNRLQARRAYDAVIRYHDRVVLTRQEEREIN